MNERGGREKVREEGGESVRAGGGRERRKCEVGRGAHIFWVVERQY